jgi:zinc and cadmium transporter
VIDGVALAAATQGMQETGASLAGVSVFLAILLHKPLDAMTIMSLMAVRGWPQRTRSLVNTAFALMCPLGALAFALGIGAAGEQHLFVYGAVLAFSAGVFLCISLSDLLPEVQFHSHDRLAMSGALLVGVAIAASLEILPR